MKSKFLLPAVALIVALSGCEHNLLPQTISDRATHTVRLWNLSMIGVIAVGSIVMVLITYPIIRYGIVKRKKIKDRHGDLELFRESEGKAIVEIVGTIVPIAIVIVLFVYTMITQIRIDKFDNRPGDSVHIGVVARQWSWSFSYNYDGNITQTKVYDIGDVNNIPSLYVPVHTKINLYLYSPDVIHSFWVPELLYKLDVIPGRENKFEFTANKTGVFSGRCAELCGLNHTFMLFKLHVVSKDDYANHLNYLTSIRQTGSLINREEFPILKNQDN